MNKKIVKIGAIVLAALLALSVFAIALPYILN